MDIVMNEFLDLIRGDPRISRYETRILKAFFEIKQQRSRYETLNRVVGFMKDHLPKLRKTIETQSSNQANFRPIKEFDGNVLVVRHENWEALISWMPLEIMRNSTFPLVWYNIKLAFYLSETQPSAENLKVIMENCRRRRDQEQISQSSEMVTQNNERAAPPPARRIDHQAQILHTSPIPNLNVEQRNEVPSKLFSNKKLRKIKKIEILLCLR